MKLIFNVAASFKTISDFISLVAEADYYWSRYVNASGPSAEASFGKFNELFGAHRFMQAGYKFDTDVLAYTSSAGNFSWVRVITPGNVEIGYIGTRHGLNLHRVMPDALYAVLKAVGNPTVYITKEPTWLWHETRHDVIWRLTGKTLREWSEIPLDKRHARLATCDINSNIADAVLKQEYEPSMSAGQIELEQKRLARH